MAAKGRELVWPRLVVHEPDHLDGRLFASRRHDGLQRLTLAVWVVAATVL